MLPCGKPYPTREAAESSPRGQRPGAVVVQCPNRACGKFHVRNAPALPDSPPRPARDSGPSAKVRADVLKRDGYRCVCCGKSIIGRRYSLAHRVRASQGGKAVPENLITLLGWGGEACHGRVDLYRDPADAGNGYRLPSGADPASVPVLYAVGEGEFAFFWLLADGTRSEQAPEGVSAA